MKTLLSPQQTGRKLRKTTSVSTLDGGINTAISYIDCKNCMMSVYVLWHGIIHCKWKSYHSLARIVTKLTFTNKFLATTH